MINNDRIVPIQKIDYLSMIGTIMWLAVDDYADVLEATEAGIFEVPTNWEGSYLANEPVKHLTFAVSVKAVTVYCVFDHEFDGITSSGEPVGANVLAGVKADGVTLYKVDKAQGESGAVTIEKVTP